MEQIQGDLIIGLTPDNQGFLTTGGCRVYVNIRGKYEQIGLIQDLKLHGKSTKPFVDIQITKTKLSQKLSKRATLKAVRQLKALMKFKNLNIHLREK